MNQLSRKIINSLLPPGIVWTPKIGGDFDKFLEGQAENINPLIESLGKLADIRDPLSTQLLEELEREFGIAKNDSLTEDQRRTVLQSIIFSSQESGTRENLEKRLRDAGFDVYVYSNDPAQDPEVILDQAFRMVAGGFNAYAGRDDAFARRQGGELIVNGDKFKQVPKYTTVAGSGAAYAGRPDFTAGQFDDFQSIKIEYEVPTNPKDWPLIFFIGGDVTRDIDGKIIAIETVLQPKELRNEFLKIILKYKPLHTWAVSVVDFI